MGDLCGHSRAAWLQGWRVLDPLCGAEFNESSFQNSIADTLEERSPCLVVVEAPQQIWHSAWVINRGDSNAKKQKLKERSDAASKKQKEEEERRKRLDAKRAEMVNQVQEERDHEK